MFVKKGEYSPLVAPPIGLFSHPTLPFKIGEGAALDEVGDKMSLVRLLESLRIDRGRVVADLG